MGALRLGGGVAGLRGGRRLGLGRAGLMTGRITWQRVTAHRPAFRDIGAQVGRRHAVVVAAVRGRTSRRSFGEQIPSSKTVPELLCNAQAATAIGTATLKHCTVAHACIARQCLPCGTAGGMIETPPRALARDDFNGDLTKLMSSHSLRKLVSLRVTLGLKHLLLTDLLGAAGPLKDQSMGLY